MKKSFFINKDYFSYDYNNEMANVNVRSICTTSITVRVYQRLGVKKSSRKVSSLCKDIGRLLTREEALKLFLEHVELVESKEWQEQEIARQKEQALIEKAELERKLENYKDVV